MLVAALFVSSNIPVSFAQPSGGPYGPVAKKYGLPETGGKVYFVAPDGKETHSGEDLSKPATIEEAVKKVRTGDVIIMRGGVYRTGNLRFNQGITIQPYEDERPVLKGTYVAKDWEKVKEGLWATSWPYLFPSGPESWWRREREEKHTPLYRFNDDMVFVDGRFLQTVGSREEVDTSTFYIDYEAKRVYIGTDPAGRMIEITAFNVAICREVKECHGKTSDGIGPVIRGIEITQYADTAVLVLGKFPEGLSADSDHGKDVVGTVIENCDISFCSRIGAFLIGDSLTFRNCRISNTSTEGLYLVSSSDVIIEKNIFTKNNIENITGFFPAAVKIFNQCYRVTCRDNLVIDLPNSNGVWYDVGNVDGVFVNNRVENVGEVNEKYFKGRRFWSGFFFEISKRVICAGNVFVNSENGIFILNSCGAEIYQNTLVNSIILIMRTERSAVGDHFGWHPSTGPGVKERFGHVCMNNLITADEAIQYPLFITFQSGLLCDSLDKPQMKYLDHNVYVRESGIDTLTLMVWSPAQNEHCTLPLNSPEELNEIHAGFSANSLLFRAYKGELFKDAANKDFRILKGFPGSRSGAELPERVGNLLGYPAKEVTHVGAYPLNGKDQH
jgi:parallel beta-helix repeat protein